MFDVGRTYHVTGSATLSTGGNIELLQGLATSAQAFLLTELFLGQVTTETLNGIVYQINRYAGGFSAGSGGSAITPAPRVSSDSAATSTWLAGNSTAISGGTKTTLRQRVMQEVIGDEPIPLPNNFLQFNLSQALQILIVTALPASTPIYFDATIVELL
jgi:hypothetical protein